MSDESCGTCRFSAPSTSPRGAELDCRRHPPAQQGRPVAEWPQVVPEGWCGEWEEATMKPARKVARPTAGDKETA